MRPDGSFLSGDAHELDPELAACLSHATRPNQTTKRRALRDLVAVVEGRRSSTTRVDDDRSNESAGGVSPRARSPETVAAALPRWHRAFARLVDDDHAETRLAAAEANAALCAGAGRGLAAHLKRVAPAWFAAAHDEDAAVAAAASASFARVFATEEKRRAVLTRCAGEVLRRVVEKLAGESDDASGAAGGSSEARRERSERTRAAALRTLAGLARSADTTSHDVSTALIRALDAIPGGLRACASSPSAKTRRAAYGAALAVAVADGAYGDRGEDGARGGSGGATRALGFLGSEAPERRSEVAAVALVDAMNETDGPSLGEARELTLGFLRRRGDDAWEDLAGALARGGERAEAAVSDRDPIDPVDSVNPVDPVDPVDAFLGSLERHVSSGCHGAAEASAPSVLPLLAAAPRGALLRKDRLRRLLASLWEGYGLCNVPSRAADAAALLRAFREATLYGAIVVAEEGDVGRAGGATSAEAFRAELFRHAFLERWVPESFRELSASRGDALRADASAATASLCECLVGVSRRPALAETCLRATMARVAADCERMVAGSSPGGGVDAAGARRVTAFHAALCAAAASRDANDEAKNGSVTDASRSDTAKRWVERAFARPVAVATARAVATEPTEAGAALLASLVERHGASCLTPPDVGSGVDDKDASRAAAPRFDSLLDACFGNAANETDEARRLTKARARARTLAAVVLSAPETWDDALRRASESARRGDASGLATVAAALEILGETREDASSSRSWRRPALDAIVVDAATARDARERLGAEAAALVVAAAATDSVAPEAAAAIARSLSGAVSGAAVASDAARDAAEAAEAWAWPPPSPDAGAEAEDAWVALVAALFGARLDEETETPPRGEGSGTRESEVEDEGSDDDESEGSDAETSCSDEEGSASVSDDASLSGSEPDASDDALRAPASATWARVERSAARGGQPGVSAQASDAEAAARAAFVAETARRLTRLQDAGDGDERRMKSSVAAARRLAGAAASALAAFGADADDAAASAASAALVGVQTTRSERVVCRVAFLGALASLFGSWSPFLAAAAAADARRGEAPGATAARLLESHSDRSGTAYARAAARDVAAAFAEALVSAPVDPADAVFADGDAETFRRDDPFASAAGALVRDAVANGVEAFGARLPPRTEAALAALRANARARPPSAASRARARAAFADAAAAAAAAAAAVGAPHPDAKTMRALALIVPLTRVDDVDEDETSKDAAFDAFAAAAAARARALLSTETRDDALGPAVALAAACYSRDAARSARFGDAAAAARLASRERIVLADGSRSERAPALLELVRAATRREAASAAAARFAQPRAPNDGDGAGAVAVPTEPTNGSEDARRRRVEEELADAFARLSVAAVERCGASLDARDWELIVNRTRRLFGARVASGEEAVERRASDASDRRAAGGDGDAPLEPEGAPAGWRAAAAGARLLLRLENLPVVVAPPDPGTASEGDVVPFGAQGEAARRVAQNLARAAWPSARAEAHASLARALMAAGAERLHARAQPSGESGWRRRRGAEDGLWADAAALWSTASGAAAVAAAAPWDAMDRWEEARCGAVAALYETLLCADEREEEETRDEKEKRRRDSACLSALRRASYALLSSPALVKPAAVGFDCAVADVEAVEQAALEAAEAAEAAPDDDDDDAREDVARLADRAALREPLANVLLDETRRASAARSGARDGGVRGARVRREGTPRAMARWTERDVSTTLCWALFLKHLGGGGATDAARERLAAFARGADAVPEIMRLALRSLPLDAATTKPTKPTSAGSAVDALPRVWRDAACAARDAGRDGGAGAGAAAAAAAADALSPAFLFGFQEAKKSIAKGPSGSNLRAFESSRGAARRARERLALGAYRACLSTLPALTRTWFSDLKDASLARALANATAAAVSPFLLEREFDAVERAARGDGFVGSALGERAADSAGELSVRVSRGTGEISATYSLDDAAVELKVRLPRAYPLVAAELDTGARAGVSEARARKWRLAVGAILRHQNGAVADGLATWRRNVDREFAGVEPCPICYLVIHGSNHQLPRLRCGQCHNKFHNACLYKWFTSSSKSTCPLCQTPWGASYRG